MSNDNLEDFFSKFGTDIIAKIEEKAYGAVEVKLGPHFAAIMVAITDIDGRDELSTMHYNCVRHEAVELVKHLLRDKEGAFEELIEQRADVYAQDDAESRYGRSKDRTRDMALVHAFAALKEALIQLLVKREVTVQTRNLVSVIASTLDAKLGTALAEQPPAGSDNSPGM
jgi:hypothetical protein